MNDIDFGARRVINQNYSHHIKNLLGIDPLETIGAWCVYYFKDLPRDWPNKQTPLSVSLTANQIAYLRSRTSEGDRIPPEPEDLPELPEEPSQ